MACSRLLRIAAVTAIVGRAMAPTLLRAETIVGPTLLVSSATGNARPVGPGVSVEWDAGQWWGIHGCYTYLPGQPGTDAAAVEALLIAPVRGFGVRVRPFVGAGVAGTRERTAGQGAGQPLYSAGALFYVNERVAITAALHNGALGDNGASRTHRSWSATLAIGKRF